VEALLQGRAAQLQEHLVKPARLLARRGAGLPQGA